MVLIRNTELISHHQPEEFRKGLKETPRVRPLPRIPLAIFEKTLMLGKIEGRRKRRRQRMR